MHKFQRPSSLKAGDRIAIVSPSSVTQEIYEQGLNRIKEELKLELIESPTARKSLEYLANYPQAFAEDINDAVVVTDFFIFCIEVNVCIFAYEGPIAELL